MESGERGDRRVGGGQRRFRASLDERSHLANCTHRFRFLLVDLSSRKGPRGSLVPALDEEDLVDAQGVRLNGNLPPTMNPRAYLVPPLVDQYGATDGYPLLVLHEGGPDARVLRDEVVQEGARLEHEEGERLEVVGWQGGRVRGVRSDEVFIVPVAARGMKDARGQLCMLVPVVLLVHGTRGEMGRRGGLGGGASCAPTC